jgi:hypothetical protein
MTGAELLAALETMTHRTPGGEGATMREIRAATGASAERVRRALEAGLAAGRVRVAQKICPRIDGVLQAVPAYVVTAAPPPPKAARRR